MKNYFRIFLLLFLQTPSFCLEKNIYSISVCTTSSKETANSCKEGILKTSKLEVFVLENQNGTYSTYLGTFPTYNEAKEILNSSSAYIKKQKPFVKEIIKIEENKKVINEKINEEEKALLNEIRKKAEDESQRLEKEKVFVETQKFEKNKLFDEEIQKRIEIQRIKDEKEKILVEILKSEEFRKKIEIENQRIKNENAKNLAEIELKKSKETQELAEIQRKTEIEIEKIKDENTKNLAKVQKSEEIIKKIESENKKIKKEMEISTPITNHVSSLDNTNNFENLIIKVDSSKNIMFLKGKNMEGEIIDIKSYVVSTAKNNIKKPQGVGSITSISLNPQWNPTNKTLKVFKEKGIILPSVVPFGDKLNYMGAAKINLSHKVDGQEVYRIHGTLSEDTIGTNESSGCIRMKNKEVVELASFLDKFSKTKSLNNISVVLE